MSERIDLKGLERRAWTSYLQDGLLDIYLGLLLVVLSIPELLSGVFASGVTQYAAYATLMLLAFVIYWAAKRYVAIPRMGRARFGPVRKARRDRVKVSYGISAVGLALTLFLILAWLGGGGTSEESWLGVRELFALGLGGWMPVVRDKPRDGFGVGPDADRDEIVEHHREALPPALVRRPKASDHLGMLTGNVGFLARIGLDVV